MLDRWTGPSSHVVTVKYRELSTTTRRYRAVCVCGWRSDESDVPQMADCPVKHALDARCRNLQRVSHIAWLPLDKPRVSD